ncbi:MAG: hypothetical protein D6685_06560, partial [Bacteroidetes bacterium]
MAHPSTSTWLVPLLGLTALGLFLLNFSIYLDRLLAPSPPVRLIDVERRIPPPPSHRTKPPLHRPHRPA